MAQLESFTFEAGHRIVRVTDPSVQSAAMVEAELDWLSFLIGRGISAHRPLSSLDGNLLETLNTETGNANICVFTRAPGRPFGFDAHWRPEFHRALGDLIGRIHTLSREYEPRIGVQRRPSWSDDMTFVRPYIPANQKAALREFDEVVEWAESLPQSEDVYGLVHADLNHSNYFVTDDLNITIFDFADSVYHWFAYDLAVALLSFVTWLDLDSKNVSDQEWFFRSLMESYLKRNPLPEEWVMRIPSFVRMRRIEMYAWSQYLPEMQARTAFDPDTSEASKEPLA